MTGHGNYYDVDGQALEERWPDADAVAGVGGDTRVRADGAGLQHDADQLGQTWTNCYEIVTVDDVNEAVRAVSQELTDIRASTDETSVRVVVAEVDS